MYFTDGSLYPENQQPLIFTAAPFGPRWLPGDADIPVAWDEQDQAALDCYNAGATMLHIHVRNPATGKGSIDFDQFNYVIGRLRAALPNMILDETLERVQELDARVVREKTAVPKTGWYAVVEDPQANVFAVWQSDPTAFPPPEPDI